ncbi:hypothetical protein Ddye_000807 [Dipteronia dyeriana]|uniref:Protein FAR1-RELATED SEQUENCE n=1 Tax=Dipteronia dyeriana TaxID=168575 RepID=A0AAE0CTF4_9ROSI|nr:hypothetical protein Ddye_000807 [Dipteronia dyeriana]
MATIHDYSGCLIDSTSDPRCGMEFDTEKIAYDFYNAYGRKMGFNIRRESYEKRLFAMFVGLNHHQETFVFVSALIWLMSIFELRQKWAYVYVKQVWSVGMKSTRPSERFNASLKDYLKSDYNLPQFFMYFERMVNDKRYKELEAEYDSCYRLVNMNIPVKMLIQARDIYTKPIFEEFQEQFIEAVELNITNCIEDNGDFIYTLTMYDAFGKGDNCNVRKGSDNKLFCSCRMFEKKWVLYGHAIKVLRDIMNIKEIPDQYLLKRWIKRARSECVQNIHGH